MLLHFLPGRGPGPLPRALRLSRRGENLYSCCCQIRSFDLLRVKVLGLPRSPLRDPNQITDHLQSWEGVYCPSLRDESGRLHYLQRSSFKNSHASQSVDKSRSLSFDLTSGQWCLAGEGCAGSEAADPIEDSRLLLAETWEAVAVTDFDGRFGTPAPTAGRIGV